MELNIFQNLKQTIEEKINVQDFINDLVDFLEKSTCDKKENIKEDMLEKRELNQYRKEGHLYLVTEDRDNKVYLWDITDKPENEIEEKDFPEKLLNIAKEGSVFRYEDGEYKFYSNDGYEMLFNEKRE